MSINNNLSSNQVIDNDGATPASSNASRPPSQRHKPSANMLESVASVYYGSSSANTRRLGTVLKRSGPMGELASLLFTIQKASSRAKCYRGIEPACGRSFRELSYEHKQEALCQLVYLLDKHATSLGIRWGWGEDDNPKMPDWVLYIDLPQGQVSFHSLIRILGKDYDAKWDELNFSESRILAFCASALEVGGQGLDAA